ncbi:DUF2057 family protein [Marinobacter changyiensis]|uniref:DUF2057 family protein n=1 Tax=Marinobacter changyiensis TaxID=2604091 RepID=UPI001263E922|nr:DUF2057 family protein [Marinobacter changyiensis]
MKFLLVLLTSVALVGCSTAMKSVQTWEGAAADADQVAVLEAPGSIQVVRVNGRQVGNFLMDDLALDYQLLPGENTVVVTHKTIWAKNTVVRNGESKVHTVKSEPQQFVLNARAGEVYRFEIPELANREEAEAFAANFDGRIVDQSGRVVAEASKPATSPRPALPVLERSPEAVAVTPAATPTAQSGEPINRLDALKQIWGQASGEEKREFLRWAFE